MEAYGDSDELYTIRQKFFSGQFKLVAETSLKSFSGSVAARAEEYILRSRISLGDVSGVLNYIQAEEQNGRALPAGLEAIRLYALYVRNPSKNDIHLKFEEFISRHTNDETTLVLGSIYLVKQYGNYEDALTLLSKGENSLECISVIVQIQLLRNRLDLAIKELKNSRQISQDSIIYNLSESWANSVSGSDDKLQSSFYFWEEISQSNTSVKSLVSLLIINLQMKHFPESKEIIDQIELLNGDDLNFLANEITYYVINGDNKKVEELIQRLNQLSKGQHPYIIDYKEKDAMFDEIVQKYSI
ncbi:coatomer subunit epsilon ASCRUDRAFT_82222 [Ascoidea rubescens DSM 1968]|uniref:Coatomer subunit epsilon n=1 Tax=Ascoidea rubescens DSM 1968 TaxID=1344418 RepID=A0A1D2VCK7_9ASCO|nr:hypothetical protein ASCRUDRAFT_82222 [Ascoidea rubescens DSM 1968]ODV59223.1 hypothetical protein ASCRUDRAFT_82222 [Ascoidea rubescens DSM 1968]